MATQIGRREILFIEIEKITIGRLKIYKKEEILR